MKKLLTTILLGLTFAQTAFGASILQGLQGGTGYGSTVAGNVGKCLGVSSVSPLTYGFYDCSGGVGTFAFPFTINSWGNSTTTRMGFLGGLNASSTSIFDNASSTSFSSSYSSSTNYFAGDITIPHLGTVAGTFLAADATGKIIATSTPSGSGIGTVTSVDMSVPTGLTISGNPITTNGTLALSFTSGYSIPLTASTTEGSTAYTWGNHALAGYLTSALTGLKQSFGATQTGATQTLATGTPDTNFGLKITTGSDTHTFTPYWIGTLADDRIASASTWNAKQNALNGTGFVKISGTTISYDNSTYLTSAVTSLGGQTGSSQTFATTTNTGGWGFASAGNVHTLNIPTQNGSEVLGLLSAANWTTFNGKQAAYTNLTSIGGLANASGWLHNDGSGTFAYSTPTKSDVGLGNVENTALSTWAGTSNILTVGTIGTGIWQGTAIADSYISSAATWNAKLSSSLTKGNFIVGNDAGTAQATSTIFIDSLGNVGIGTTTPTNKLTIIDTTYPQISFSSGAGISQWTMRNAGGNFYIASTTNGGTSTTTTSAIEVQNNATTTIRNMKGIDLNNGVGGMRVIPPTTSGGTTTLEFF